MPAGYRGCGQRGSGWRGVGKRGVCCADRTRIKTYKCMRPARAGAMKPPVSGAAFTEHIERIENAICEALRIYNPGGASCVGSAARQHAGRRTESCSRRVCSVPRDTSPPPDRPARGGRSVGDHHGTSFHCRFPNSHSPALGPQRPRDVSNGLRRSVRRWLVNSQSRSQTLPHCSYTVAAARGLVAPSITSVRMWTARLYAQGAAHDDPSHRRVHTTDGVCKCLLSTAVPAHCTWSTSTRNDKQGSSWQAHATVSVTTYAERTMPCSQRVCTFCTGCMHGVLQVTPAWRAIVCDTLLRAAVPYVDAHTVRSDTDRLRQLLHSSSRQLLHR